MEKRKFEKGEFTHIYQRTAEKCNIFYDLEDYLVYYTIFSILAKRYRIVCIGLCLMIDHIHTLVRADSMDVLSRFMSNVNIQFVKEYNSEYGRKGRLFDRFGSAPKKGLKLLRTAIAYLYNNPVEKRLCRYAQDFRWNFLKYGQPGRRITPVSRYGSSLRRAVKEIDYAVAANHPLRYKMLHRLMDGLRTDEKKILTDHIIQKYSVIRYDILSDCYGGWDNVLMAINSNAGSEYSINEHGGTHSDLEYRELYRFVRDCEFKRVGDVISLQRKEKMVLADNMLRNTSANKYQICSFLHLHFDV